VERSYAQSGRLDLLYVQFQFPDPEHGFAAIIAYFRPDADLIEWRYVLSIISKIFTYDLKKSADRSKAFARSFIQRSHESVRVLRHEVMAYMAYYFIT